MLLISWLQSPSEVILQPQKVKFVTDSIVSPSVIGDVFPHHSHAVMGLDAMILLF